MITSWFLRVQRTQRVNGSTVSGAGWRGRRMESGDGDDNTGTERRMCVAADRAC
jgi:hypothetical protein